LLNTFGDTNAPAARTNSSAFVHESTRFSFPDAVENFRRVDIHKYDKEGRDMGVGYNSPLPIAATVYVYPGPKDFSVLPALKSKDMSEALLNQHFKLCKQDITRNHPEAKFLGEGNCTITQGKNKFEGRKATYSFDYKFGPQAVESISELYVFLLEPGVKFLATDRHFVKYRVTYPAAMKSEAESETSAFMAKLPWPVKEQKKAKP
jgi:hypothetical protein